LAADEQDGQDFLVQVQDERPYWSLTEKIIGAAFEVHRNLGQGFLESVYVKALLRELNAVGLKVQSEQPIPVTYKGVEIGIFYADLIVENRVICEVNPYGHSCRSIRRNSSTT
jgi:GxxExxY protein